MTEFRQDFMNTDFFKEASQRLSEAKARKARVMEIARRLSQKASMRVELEELRMQLRYKLYRENPRAYDHQTGKLKSKPKKGGNNA